MSFISSWLIDPQGSPAVEIFAVEIEGVGEGCEVETLIPAFQIVFFPDLIQVNVFPAEVTFWFSTLQGVPGLITCAETATVGITAIARAQMAPRIAMDFNRTPK